MFKKLVVLVGLVTLASLGGACGSSDSTDCVGSCQTAQSKNCTSIKQNCTTYCNAVLSISSKANCGAQKDSYLGCLTSGDVCTSDARCGSQQVAFGTCAGLYCLTHATDADCQAIVP